MPHDTPPMRTLAAQVIPMVVFIGSVAAGCASEPERTVSEEEARALIGTWTADDTTRFIFAEEGEALWIFGDGVDEDTFSIRYDYVPNAQPARLDLSGFERGFLRGRTLYCIVELDVDAQFTLDCEPGGMEESDVRPDTFTQKAMTYRAYQPD